MKILDVGGAIMTYEKATHIIDIIDKPDDCTLQYFQQDVCDGTWPFNDGEFDFVYCSNLLEDVKDPVHVCNEMKRVGKSGKIVVPSVMTECTLGVDTWHNSDRYAGFCHHRWICIADNKNIRFVPKWDIVHAFDWTGHISKEMKEANFYTVLDWKDTFGVFETKYVEWTTYYKFLSDTLDIKPLGDKI